MKTTDPPMQGHSPEVALAQMRLRQKGRAVKSAASGYADHPPAWGPWEWRPHVTDPRNRLVRAARARGIRTADGLQNACLNEVYSVQFFVAETAWGTVDHLMIRRHDEGTDVPWHDKQRIKDELLGSDRIAVEVYPARKDLVDAANIYHLWVLPTGFSLPFGLHRIDEEA
jgi:hypothetical protein